MCKQSQLDQVPALAPSINYWLILTVFCLHIDKAWWNLKYYVPQECSYYLVVALCSHIGMYKANLCCCIFWIFSLVFSKKCFLHMTFASKFTQCHGHVLNPQLLFFFRHLFNFLSDEEKKVVKSLGYKVLSDLQAGMISSSSVLVASIMLQNLQGLHFGMFWCEWGVLVS